MSILYFCLAEKYAAGYYFIKNIYKSECKHKVETKTNK